MGKHQIIVLHQSRKAFWKKGTSVVIWLESWKNFFYETNFYWKKNWQMMTNQAYLETISSKMKTESLSLQGKQLRPLTAADDT